MQSGDVYVVWLIVLVLGAWLYFWLKRKWSELPTHPAPYDDDPIVSSGDAMELLEAEGYEIVLGKHKVPIRIDADGDRMESRLFVDAIARKEDETFVVRVARPRKPLEWTGSSVRDHLLVYALLYDDLDGVLYVDPDDRTVRTIRFELDR